MRVRSRAGRVATSLIGALVLALVAAGCSATSTVVPKLPAQVNAQFAADTQKQLQDAMTSTMTAVGASGAIVGVWAPWSGQWVAGLGTQSTAGGAKVTADMDFRVADLTRAMTCDVLYRMADQGRVALSDTVSAYLSSYPDLKGVTLQQLCDGTADIGSYRAHLQSLILSNPTRVWDPRELVSYGLGQGDGAATATPYHGSDAAYVLLGLVLERVAGRSMAELLHDEVFSPLGLEATALPGSPPAAPATTGTALDGYNSLPGADGAMNCATPLNVTETSATVGSSAAGVVSDVQDVRTYVQALATKALMPTGTKRFAQPVPVYDGAPAWYTAAGGAYQAGSLVGQFGAVPGYATAAFADPTTGLTVVVVLNNSGAGAAMAAYAAWELAAIASKAPASAGQTAPSAGLPWTAQQYHDQIAAAAICSAPAS